MKKILTVLMTLVCLTFISFSITLAGDAPYREHMSKGKAFLEDRRYGEAVDEFRKAVELSPEDHDARLNLGIALSRSGSIEAATHFKRALSTDPSDPKNNLELGIYYFNRQIFTEAADYFETTKEIAPGTDYLRQADEYLARIRGVKAEKSWSLGISVGEQYDSNVLINSDNSPLPAGITGKADWKNIIYLNGRVKFIRTEQAEASLGYSLYQSFHYNLSDFNVTQNLADLTFTYKLNPSLHVGGSYRFEYILVGGNDYDNAHSIGPSITILEGNGLATEIQYYYKYTSFKDNGLFATNSDRSGPNNLISITQTIPISSAVKAEVGYAYDRDLAREDFWKYNGNKGFASFAASLPSRFLLTFYGEYYVKKFDSTFPLSGKARKDNAGTLSVSATKFFTETIGVTLGETYIHNNSNIDVFDYNRSITSLLAHVRF